MHNNNSVKTVSIISLQVHDGLMMMLTDAKMQLLMRTVAYLEVSHGAQQVEWYVCYLGHVSVTVADWNSADHHVRITDCLYLERYHDYSYYYYYFNTTSYGGTTYNHMKNNHRQLITCQIIIVTENHMYRIEHIDSWMKPVSRHQISSDFWQHL